MIFTDTDIESQYRATTEWLFSQLAVFQNTGGDAYKPGLQTANRLAEMFGNPHENLLTIHVGGTNGKGSTSSSIASILQAAGYRTGLYTSPHLVDFRERIRINGEMISREEVIDFTDRYRKLENNSAIPPSFFELSTIMAFEYFKRHKVDIAVIEVGLGGRLDTTNIITPCLSVITNISFDHVALLGNTLEEIASEKAGIIKTGVPVVIGEASGNIRRVFDEKASDMNAPILFAEDFSPIKSYYDDGMSIVYLTYNHGTIRGCLRGDCQPLNTATVLTAVDVLNSSYKMNITDDSIRRGLATVDTSTGLTGRWTEVRKSPRVICDTGHNIGGWRHTVVDLNSLPGHKILVLGFVNDKDVSAILDCVKSVHDAEIIFTSASVHRALGATTLKSKANERGIDGDAISPVPEAVTEALMRAEKTHSTVFVGGSNFVVGDFLSSTSSIFKK